MGQFFILLLLIDIINYANDITVYAYQPNIDFVFSKLETYINLIHKLTFENHVLNIV